MRQIFNLNIENAYQQKNRLQINGDTLNFVTKTSLQKITMP